MAEITQKELTLLNDVLSYEGLICKKARMYSRTLTDIELADCMTKIADSHEQRYNALLNILGG
ncbi:MAG: hypothetical protein E7370_06090 [Clostridiales bacterium]|nr:hypothetical protein [Clostridiales bacterium]